MEYSHLLGHFGTLTMRSVFRSALVNDFISQNDYIWKRQKKLVQTSCALQNKNWTLKTSVIPYFLTWFEIIFFRNISDRDVGSPP